VDYNYVSIPSKKGRPKLVLLPTRIQGPTQKKENENETNHSQIWSAPADLHQGIPLFPMPAGYSASHRILDVLVYCEFRFLPAVSSVKI
jgi:hypothetical protein